MADIQGADWRSDLDLILDAAREAGRVALKFFRNDPEVWWKNGGHSPVSAADYAANDILEKMLRSARPDYGWLSEETTDDQERLSRNTLFVVDPIDGTRAFIGGKDTWCVSVAVVHKGRPVAAVLVAPAFEEEFTAVPDAPALKNGKPLSVASSQGGIIQLAAPEDVIAKLPVDFRGSVRRVAHVPSLAYRLAMVSDGRIDGTLVKPNSHDWDLAAADLILQQAGGSLVDLDGKPLIYNRSSVSHAALCAATNEVLPTLLGQLNRSFRG
ncbi:3'(2'),5'-bisphosphate nucleotidase CysQ [Agrobacterium larrymoorei]|uniref:3'(2'),5'-bisphosphate nucleotidase CysQ n=1 Tax=Agrobacterium larrymoorei TaxID=160699 RepID=UPI001573D03E|nr:3'(2'),5'-bisphosphate nucleotidase CysQ [Agrobacterium larrymoorei]NTJ41464.1 3'(2'),5'-bisphosphate nucleotidase CysQ [Agrobacterium larrymoorei]